MSRRRLAINIVSNVASFVVSFFVGFILTPYITKHVGKDAYGFIGLALNLTSYIGTATIAVNSMAGRFIAIHYHKQDFEQANDYYNSVLIVNTLIAAVLIVPCALVVVYVQDLFHVPARLVGDVQALFALTFAWFLIGLCGTAFGVATFISNRLDLSSLRSIGASVIRLVVVGALYLLFKPAVYYMGLAFALIALFEVLVNRLLIKSLTPKLFICYYYARISCIVRLFKSGFWNSLNAIGNILARGLDLLLANLYLGSLQMGTLAIAKILPNLTITIIGSVANAFAPQFTKTYSASNTDALRKDVLQSMAILGVLNNVFLSLLVSHGKVFYRLWLPHENAEKLYILTLLGCIDLVVAGSMNGFYNLFYALDKIKFPSIVYFCSGLLSVLCTLFLLAISSNEWYRLIAITATSTLISTFVALVFLPVYAASCLSLQANQIYRELFKVICSFMVTACCAAVFVRLANLQGWLSFTISLFVVLLMSFLFNLLVLMGRPVTIALLKSLARGLQNR